MRTVRRSGGSRGVAGPRRARALLCTAVTVACLAASSTACVVAPPPPEVHPPHPLRIVYFGDSIGFTLGGWYSGITTPSTASGDITYIPGYSRLGCAIARYTLSEPTPWNPEGTYNTLCDWTVPMTWNDHDYPAYGPGVAANAPIDFAVLVFCGWDWLPRRIPLAGGGWDPVYRPLSDPVYADYVRSELSAMIDVILAAGARQVVMLTCAFPYERDFVTPRDNAQSVVEWNQFIRAFPAVDPRLRLLEFGPWLDAQRPIDKYRSDAEHFDESQASLAHRDWLDREYIVLSRELFPS